MLTSSYDVSSICVPLFQKTDIDWFSYGRIYRDGSGACLESGRGWSPYCVENQLSITKNDINHIIENRDRFSPYFFTLFTPDMEISHFIDSERYLKTAEIARDKFNLYYLLGLIVPYDDYIELGLFSTELGNASILNFYLNYNHQLYQFLLYFIEAAASLITQSLQKENRLIIPEGYHLEVNQSKVKLKQSFLDDTLKKCPLSVHEIRCLHYLAHGETAKSIAKKLAISHRTVEKHFANIRSKLNCHSKLELIHHYHNQLSYIPSDLFLDSISI